MALLTKAPKGTKDILPSQVHKWQYIEATVVDLAEIYGFTELRTPTFEYTDLFVRSVGDTTDVVQKEMYTFMDKKDRSITLKPEGTAGAVRALLESGVLNDALPVKVSYVIPCFRYERPQAGRLREFHQFGVELLGAPQPSADAEVIALVCNIFKKLEVKDIHLEINSIGCPECRPNYHTALKNYLDSRKENLCKTCLDRLDKNPMRVLDCKEKGCASIVENAPVITDFLCGECNDHYTCVQAMLTAMGIEYKMNSHIVRGLDYYTKTVFEFISDKIGAQCTVCGGGRYDGLVEELGGKPTPGIGFAMGIERLISVMENCGASFPEPAQCELYIATLGDVACVRAAGLVNILRQKSFYAQTDLVGRSLKAQMKYADKIGAKYSMVIGDVELETGKAQIKNMKTGKTSDMTLGNDIADDFYTLMLLADNDDE